MSLAYHRLAGAAGTTITCPLEVVKTRLQVWLAELGDKCSLYSNPFCAVGLLYLLHPCTCSLQSVRMLCGCTGSCLSPPL